MILFLSDLHVADDPRRNTLDIKALLEALEGQLAANTQDVDCNPKLILLGDIFEMLKSDVWFELDTRPWSSDRTKVLAATVEIMNRIVRSNSGFFDGLRRLQTKFALEITYVPGNHDALMGEANHSEARSILRNALTLSGAGGDKFNSHVIDLAHGVFALHGHEFDEFNSPPEGNDPFVAGDAVVVEFIAALARNSAAELGLDPALGQFDPRLAFLLDIDNVSPHTARNLALWIEHGLQSLLDNDLRKVEAAVLAAIRITLERLTKLFAQSTNVSRVRGALLTALSKYLYASPIERLQGFASWQAARGDELQAVEQRVRALATEVESGTEAMIDIFVAGHTHLPIAHPFHVRGNQLTTYLNTGTWRRVFTASPTLQNATAFRRLYESTLLCVYRKGAGRPRYEYQRIVRGY